VLYVEGARDRDIMRAWSYRLLAKQASRVFRTAVILGGRQPARAIDHFSRLEAGARGLCVLDRDDGSAAATESAAEGGLEFFTWSRRHIESYLLVPSALHRALRISSDDGRLGRLLATHLPPDGDEEAYRALNAKRFLAPGGELARGLDRPIPLGSVARATRTEELHLDVHTLFDRLRDGLGVSSAPVVIR